MRLSKHLVALVGAVFFLSLVSIFGRFLPSNGYVNTFFGYGFVLLFTCIVVVVRGGVSQLVVKARKWDMLVLGLGQLGSAAFFLRAIQSVDLAVAGLLLYSAPLWVVVLYLVTREERITRDTFLHLLLGFLGLVFVIGPDQLLRPYQMSAGVFIGLLSGFSYALSFVFARKVHVERYSTATIVFWNHLIGVLVLLPFLAIYEFSTTPVNLLWFLLLGVSWFAGYFLLYSALREVQAQHASIIALFEPVFIALWGVMFFAEVLDPLVLLGGVLLLINIYFINKHLPE